jgi:hypothetical protein
VTFAVTPWRVWRLPPVAASFEDEETARDRTSASLKATA